MKHEFRDYLDDIQRSMELALSFTTDMSLADFRGTNPDGDTPIKGQSRLLEWFREQARASGVENEPERPALMGRHLKGYIEPGPEMGRVLQQAYRIHLEDGITDVEELRRRVLEDV